nr:protocatechuate 3,4-dioxygenase subunit alpha [Streptomyces alanosinicus]
MPPPTLVPTPPQTIGPYFGHALPFAGGTDIAPDGHPDTVTVHGHLYDGEGDPVPDGLLEIWQPAPDGTRTGAPGSRRREPAAGHNGFTGFGRVATDARGRWTVRTLPPGGIGYLSLCLFVRGLPGHLRTRLYLPPAQEDSTTDPLLSALPPDRRRTLIAVPTGPHSCRFDIHLQGPEETVFLDFDHGFDHP